MPWTLDEGQNHLYCTHRLSTVQCAHKIVVLAGGKIVEEGTHQELLHKGGVYAKMVQGGVMAAHMMIMRIGIERK